jgi:hypothetical protein
MGSEEGLGRCKRLRPGDEAQMAGKAHETPVGIPALAGNPFEASMPGGVQGVSPPLKFTLDRRAANP